MYTASKCLKNAGFFGSLRLFSRSVPSANKKAIQERWKRKTERYMRRTAALISGTDGQCRSEDKDFKGKIHNFSPHNVIVGTPFGSSPSAGNQQRARHLSVILFDYITSLVSSGEVCPQLAEYGFEIIKVKLSQDLNVLNISWAATGGTSDELISALLPDCAIELRSKLIDLRIMGHLPPIQFVKDMTVARLNEVEKLLAAADMGPDHEPSTLGHQWKTEPSLVGLHDGGDEMNYRSERNAHKDRNRSSLAEFACSPGPGNSVEISTTHTGRDVSGAHASIVGTSWSNALHDDREQFLAEYDSISDANEIALADGQTKHGCMTSQIGDHSSNEINNNFAAVLNCRSSTPDDEKHSPLANLQSADAVISSFRSDLYGVDHSTLYNQVLQAKRRAENRSYVKNVDVRSSSAGGNFTDLSKSLIKSRMLSKQSKSKEKSDRNMKQLLLSSHYHMDSD